MSLQPRTEAPFYAGDTVDVGEMDRLCRLAVAKGRIRTYRAHLSVLFLDRKRHLTAARNARARGARPYYGAVNDIEDSIRVHWRLMNEARRDRDDIAEEMQRPLNILQLAAAE